MRQWIHMRIRHCCVLQKAISRPESRTCTALPSKWPQQGGEPVRAKFAPSWSGSSPRQHRRLGSTHAASTADAGGIAMASPEVHSTADVDDRASLGPGTKVWHLAQVREYARLGSSCIVGRGAYVGPGVLIGNNVKLQNYSLVYEPAQIEDDVFIGPGAILTNDMHPRSVDVKGKLKRPGDWDADGVIVRQRA